MGIKRWRPGGCGCGGNCGVPQNLNAVRRQASRREKTMGKLNRGAPLGNFFCGFIVDSFKLVYNGLSTVGIMMDISFIFVYNVYSR